MPIEFINIAQSHEAYERNFLVDGKHSPLIKTDQQRLMQIILGLLSNALKFTSKGHVKSVVRLFDDETSQKNEKLIEISI